ncbi:glycosyltransferase [uncultured Thiocystis sp.]|jgi:glycosyltransferase involved in cell wall biosynthesis|uniref:glycosyltransferase n=1 Tax=uncultured Thiocystis sp. TaxID=1202134 RepID=UPI0025F161D8|nr:glycosyltransferase [uncultured Thiocystis sp.]
MNILHVITTLSPRYGGPTTVLKALARQQVQAGLNVTICTTNADHPKGILDVPPNVPILEDGVTTWYFSVDFHPLVVSRSLWHWARRSLHTFDLVHIHGLYRFPLTYCARLARKQGIPYVISPHGALDPYLYARSTASLGLKRLYERWFDLPNLHGAGAIHYTAEDERRLAAFLQLRAPSFVVPNGIDWAPFDQLPPRGAFRQAMSIGDAPLVLFLGRLHHKKGLDILVPAFDQVRRSLPHARLAIVGPANDDYGDQVRAWVRERGLEQAVVFVEFLTGIELVQAYVDADVFVLPSYTENFGMTVVESMACALPVIISRHVNIHHEVTEEGAGLVTECDADEVARAILELLNDPERRQRLGENGRRAAQSRYTWPRIVDLLSEEYRRVIERRRANGR